MATATDADLLVHALAQLPETVTAALPRNRRLDLMIRAYGLEERVEQGAVEAEGETLAELVASLGGGPAATERGDDSLLAGARIAIVTNLPVHYRIPLFTGLARRLERAGASLLVSFAAAADPARPWVVPAGSLEFEHSFAPVRRALRDWRANIVLAGGFSRRTAAAATHRATFGIWSGETEWTAVRRRGRTAFRRALLRRASFGIAYGSLGAAYLRALAPSVPVVVGRNASPLPGRARGGDGRVEVLAVARAIPGKGLEHAVDAFAELDGATAHLTVVGGGPALEQLAARAGADVRFTGPLTPDAVREEMERADVFLFPSEIDVFGLSLLEALGSGLAVATAPRPGAVADLVSSGTGVVVADGDWAGALRRLVADAQLRASLGAGAARTVAERWTIAHAVDAMVAGLRLAISTGRA